MVWQIKHACFYNRMLSRRQTEALMWIVLRTPSMTLSNVGQVSDQVLFSPLFALIGHFRGVLTSLEGNPDQPWWVVT